MLPWNPFEILGKEISHMRERCPSVRQDANIEMRETQHLHRFLITEMHWSWGKINVQSSKVKHWCFGKYYCAVCGFVTCISVKTVKLENKDLKASTISVASSTLPKNVCGTMESRKSSTEAAFWCGLLLLITDVGSPALLGMTHQCPLIKHRHGFSYHNMHWLCCASSCPHFLLRKWISTVHSHSICPIINT